MSVSHPSESNSSEITSYEDSFLCNTEPKAKTDRYVYTRRWSERKRCDLVPTKSASSVSKEHTLESYTSCLAKSLSQSPQTIRTYTLNRLREKTGKRKLDGVFKNFRTSKIEPVRKYRVIGWRDNYYTNLLDWSYNNFICTGYLNDLCLYNMQIDDQFESSLYKAYPIGLNGEQLTSLKSSPYQTRIALGYSNGSIKIYDYFKQKQYHSGTSHSLRIAALEWAQNLIISGSKDQHLKFFDVRQRKQFDAPCSIQKIHTQQICGIKQRDNYLATGGNDNRVFIYDLRKMEIISTYTHEAAVKGITWIGNHEIVTGGGTADKKLKFWKDGEGIYKEIDTGSQVCSLGFCEQTNQIYSCQGFSLNQIIIWSKEGERNFTFHGHSSRVLYSAISPSGEYLASGAGDQFLKIWKLFPAKKDKSDLSLDEIR